jgi:calcineurin-like phosphoesterase
MVGPERSVLGVKPEIIIRLFLTGLPQKFEIGNGPCIFNSLLVEMDRSGKVLSAERVDRIVEMKGEEVARG